MADEEWHEPESFEKDFSNGVQKIFFDGGDRSKYGVWTFELAKDGFYHYRISHVASCRMKILKSTDFISPDLKSNATFDVKVGGDVIGLNVIRSKIFPIADHAPVASRIRIEFQRSKSCPCSNCRNVTALNAYEELCSSSHSADVVFQVGNVEIPAHKSILSARYDYFRALFSSDMQETRTNRVEVKDTDAEAFKGMLRFIYSAKLPADIETKATNYLPIADQYNIADLKDACSKAMKKSLSTENIKEIFYLADLYQCKDLVMACWDAMKKSLTKQNVMETLILAQRYGKQDAKEVCLGKIKELKCQGKLDAKMLQSLHEDPKLMSEVILKT